MAGRCSRARHVWLRPAVLSVGTKYVWAILARDTYVCYRDNARYSELSAISLATARLLTLHPARCRSATVR